MLKKASVGASVLFYSQTIADKNPQHPGYGYNGLGAGPYAAVVTQVFTDTDGNVTYANLKVFPPFAPPFDQGSVAERGHPYAQPGLFWTWPDSEVVGEGTEPAPADAALFVPSQFMVSWGSVHGTDSRRFDAFENNDAVTRFAERVLELDRDPLVSAGWVHLHQVDGEEERHLIGWTKTSDERPTSEGRTGHPKTA